MVARFVRDEEVVGSNPATPTQVKGPFPHNGKGPQLLLGDVWETTSRRLPNGSARAPSAAHPGARHAIRALAPPPEHLRALPERFFPPPLHRLFDPGAHEVGDVTSAGYPKDIAAAVLRNWRAFSAEPSGTRRTGASLGARNVHGRRALTFSSHSTSSTLPSKARTTS